MKTKDPNRTAKLYTIETWDRRATFAVIETSEPMRATEVAKRIEELRGTNTAYRVIVDYGRPHGGTLASTVLESLYHPHEGWIDAPINAIQHEVYQERARA